ncbi:MAG: phosphoribosylglycinamide formyltransferase [Acidobacteria bacterium]|nr:phosphoribosylglycinamide formyltransferase [Acidobacteriota bacterium]
MAHVRLCVLVSGSGTILESIINAGLDVTLVASDRPCRGLEVAQGAGIEALLVGRADYGGFSARFDREGYSKALAQVLTKYRIDLVAMAGFGTIMTGVFHEAFPGRVLNTHPSLLPDFKGWHAVAQALEAKVAESGCTVHIATEELDNGPVLAQRRVPVYAEDDEASLHERIKDVERQLYPLVLTRVMASMDQGDEPISVAGALEEN